jgi:hypothetical protein
MQQPSYPDAGSHPSYPDAGARMMASYPTVDPSPHAFPPPGAYPTEQALRAAVQPKSSLGPLLLGAVVGLTTVTLVVGGYYAYRMVSGPTSQAASSTSAPGAGSAGVSAAPKTDPAKSGAPPSSSASGRPSDPPATDSEAAARKALETFAEGLKKCVGETIGVLPGTSPPVPSALGFLKNGPYRPGIKDFDSSVYNCADFKLTAPMPFVFQWQADGTRGQKGAALAFLDDDRDGKVDRVIGFEAKLAKRKVAEIGPIETMDSKRVIKKR